MSISVGRFSHQKNFLDIITAFASIHSTIPNYYHLFLGEGELKDYYQKIVLDLGLSDRILFLGYRKDIDRFLALSDVFISTSLYEGLALSILEAAQFSCPIIAANSSSAQEIITSPEYGLLYNSGQYNLLAEHIKFACLHQSEMKIKADKLNYLCQDKFSLDKFKRDLENIINNFLYINKKTGGVSVSYNPESESLKIDESFRLTNYQYQGLPTTIIPSAAASSFSFSAYTKQFMEQNHHKYLHCLNKLAKQFNFGKIILCFNDFNPNFFRSYYSKEEYLLIVISQCQSKSITFNFHYLNHTYWGQDLYPDYLAKFTIFEEDVSLAELENIDSQQAQCPHFYTSSEFLASHLELSNSKTITNLSINLTIIDRLFRPTEYYLLEQDRIYRKNKQEISTMDSLLFIAPAEKFASSQPR